MSEAQITEFANAMFDEFDKNKNGTIDVQEVRTALERIAEANNTKVSEEDVAQAMKDLDTNSDGVITREEFFKLVKLSITEQ